MSPPKAKKRISILKKRRSSFESPEATATTTEKPRRGILFSEKNTVKEFMQCDEKTTIWGNSYELSIARSDGSNDGTSSKKLSFDFTSTTLQTTSVTATSMVLESDKENTVVPESFIIPPPPKESLDGGSKSNSLNNSSGITNMTVEFNADEKARIKKYGTDNLNITNMNLETSQLSKNNEKMVLSPRKTIYFNNSANISVCVQDKVLLTEPEASKQNVSDSITFSLEEDEKQKLKNSRKTILNNADMDLTLESSSRAGKVCFGEVKPTPVLFKQPETPKPFRMGQRFLDNSSLVHDSPPIKPPMLGNQKQAVEEFMDFLVTETPTKNSCLQMCASKKHSITPLQSMPPAKLRTIEKLRNNISFDLRLSHLQRVEREESAMELEVEKTPEKPKNVRQTVFDSSVAVEATEIPSTIKEARKTLFDDEIDETLSQKTEVEAPQDTFFDLDIDETVAGTKSVTLVRLKDLPGEQSSRKTVYDSDLSYTCNFVDMKPSSTMMNYSNMDETGVSESTNELARKAARLLKDPMANTASTSNLFTNDLELAETDISIDSFQKSLPAQIVTRKTVYDTNMSLNLDHEPFKFSQDSTKSYPSSKFVSKSDIDISGIEPTDEIPKSIIKHSRETIYSNQSIKEDTEVKTSTKSPQKIAKKSRGTIYANESIQEDTEPKTSGAIPKKDKKTRGTIYADQSIQEDTEVKVSSDIPKAIKKTRRTIYADQSIQEDTEVKASSDIPKAIKKSRGTIYANHSIQEETTRKTETLLTKTKRGTIYSNDGIDETNVEGMIGEESIDLTFKVSKKERITIYEDSPIKEEEIEKNSPAAEKKSRKTIHDELPMNVTQFEDDHEVSVARRVTESQSIPQFEDTQQFNLTRFSATSFDMKDSLTRPVFHENVTPIFIPPPPEFDSQIFAVPQPPEIENNDMDLSEDTASRKSVIVGPSKDVSNLRISHLRKTVYDAVNMEVDKNVDHTFTVRKRDDSKKLMNITDADIISLIDEESDPCINESTQSSGNRISFGGNNSIYQNALQDFVNITIMNSPLSTSSYEPTPAQVSRVRNRVISEPIDYTSKLDDLIESLDKKSEAAPRLAIDDFLEKLNIRPLKIPTRPELNPDWLLKEDEKCKERIVKALTERRERIKAKELLQQPLIPTYSFLIRNKLANMDEEIHQRLQNESKLAIAPVFPELRDFDSLLANKFETDEHLSQFWQLDLLWSWKNQYKVFHKLLPSYKINFGVRNSSGNINESTIPIYFDNVLMYVSPDFRGKKSTRTKFLMTEFKRAVATDNFTSMCSSTSQLFSFLDFFHQQVMQIVKLVDTFLSIISKNSAILERNEELNSLHILKRHFNQDDIVDIKIEIAGHIEDTSVSCVIVKSHTRYAYELQPRQTFAALKGLMLIETVLFNVEKFLQDNTRRLQVE